MRAGAIFVLLLAGIGLSACDGKEPTLPEPVRPIRTITITEVAAGQVRRFPGLIEAIDSSNLSFQVGGKVERVLVNQGSAVKRGQILAELDQEPYRLNVQAAEAELQRARAYLAQTRADYDRSRRLIEQRAISRVQLEVSQRDYQSAQSQVDYAGSRLNLAQRDLRNTILLAPFDGTVAERLIDPFVHVQAGQKLFRIDAKGGMQASIGVPETSIAEVVLGMPAIVTLPQIATPISARISEIGTAAEPGNVFPVKAALIDPPERLRAGMTAEVTLVMPEAAGETSYFVPLSAIAPGDGPGHGYLFVYDPTTSTVRRTQVRSSGPLASNKVAVTGINAGDIVASAGVNFLVDGQKVRLMGETTAPAGS